MQGWRGTAKGRGGGRTEYQPAACIPAPQLGAGTSRREVGGASRGTGCPMPNPRDWRYVRNANGMLEWTASERGAGMALAAICCEPRRPIATASQEWGYLFFFFSIKKFFLALFPAPAYSYS